MLVCSNLVAVSHAGIEHELSVDSKRLRSLPVCLLGSVRSSESQEEGLDHMVAISMSRHLEYVLRHLSTDRQNLIVQESRICAQSLNQSLNDPSSVQIH